MSDLVLDPMLMESIEAGVNARITQWLVSEGDHVHAGQTLARADLVHTVLDVITAHAGIVEEIVVPTGAAFGRGDVLARLIAA